MRQPAVSPPAGPLGVKAGGLILLFNDQYLSPDLFLLLSALRVCHGGTDQSRRASLCPRANCCYLADSLS